MGCKLVLALVVAFACSSQAFSLSHDIRTRPLASSSAASAVCRTNLEMAAKAPAKSTVKKPVKKVVRKPAPKKVVKKVAPKKIVKKVAPKKVVKKVAPKRAPVKKAISKKVVKRAPPKKAAARSKARADEDKPNAPFSVFFLAAPWLGIAGAVASKAGAAVGA
jgi:outer membrane biosynthesis protein TonB